MYVYIYISESIYVHELKWNRLLLFIENFHIRCPVLKKLSKFDFHECLRPNGLDAPRAYRAFQKYAIVSRGEEKEKVAPSREIRQKQYRSSNASINS